MNKSIVSVAAQGGSAIRRESHWDMLGFLDTQFTFLCSKAEKVLNLTNFHQGFLQTAQTFSILCTNSVCEVTDTNNVRERVAA